MTLPEELVLTGSTGAGTLDRLAKEGEGLSGAKLSALAMAEGRKAVRASIVAARKPATARDGAQEVLKILEGATT